MGPFQQLQYPECDVDHSPPSIGKIKNKWSYTSAALLYAFVA
jgi:hypothetical protein